VPGVDMQRESMRDVRVLRVGTFWIIDASDALALEYRPRSNRLNGKFMHAPRNIRLQERFRRTLKIGRGVWQWLGNAYLGTVYYLGSLTMCNYQSKCFCCAMFAHYPQASPVGSYCDLYYIFLILQLRFAVMRYQLSSHAIRKINNYAAISK
jgi:hypothetical protein